MSIAPLESIGAALGVVATAVKLVPMGWRRVKEHQAWKEKRRQEWHRVVDGIGQLTIDMAVVKKEMQTNGGSSVKDAVNRLMAELSHERVARRSAWRQAAYEVAIDKDGVMRVLHVTPEWTALTGLTREESEREGWAMSIHHNERERVVDAAREAAERGTVFFETYVVQNTRTHQRVRVDHVGTPILTASRVTGWIGVLTPHPDTGEHRTPTEHV